MTHFTTHQSKQFAKDVLAMKMAMWNVAMLETAGGDFVLVIWDILDSNVKIHVSKKIKKKIRKKQKIRKKFEKNQILKQIKGDTKKHNEAQCNTMKHNVTQ
jgi:hypothetical protein